jgi:hypothetical protein
MYIVKIPTPLFMCGIHKFKTKKSGVSFIEKYLIANPQITFHQSGLIYILKEVK